MFREAILNLAKMRWLKYYRCHCGVCKVSRYYESNVKVRSILSLEPIEDVRALCLKKAMSNKFQEKCLPTKNKSQLKYEPLGKNAINLNACWLQRFIPRRVALFYFSFSFYYNLICVHFTDILPIKICFYRTKGSDSQEMQFLILSRKKFKQQKFRTFLFQFFKFSGKKTFLKHDRVHIYGKESIIWLTAMICFNHLAFQLISKVFRDSNYDHVKKLTTWK